MKMFNISVEGHVQGVGFRYSTKKLADSIGILGTVRNKADGSVAIEAVGSDEQLDQFINELENNPTPFSEVSKVTFEENNTLQNFLSFEITN